MTNPAQKLTLGLGSMVQVSDRKTYLWVAGNEGMEKKRGNTVLGYVGTAMRIHSGIIPRYVLEAPCSYP